jgi:hypothetical protein
MLIYTFCFISNRINYLSPGRERSFSGGTGSVIGGDIGPVEIGPDEIGPANRPERNRPTLKLFLKWAYFSQLFLSSIRYSEIFS